MVAVTVVDQVMQQSSQRVDMLTRETKDSARTAYDAARTDIVIDTKIELQNRDLTTSPKALEQYLTRFTGEIDDSTRELSNIFDEAVEKFLDLWFKIKDADGQDAGLVAWIKKRLNIEAPILSANMENLLWGRTHDRINAEKLAAEQDAVSQVASRGFSLPQGAMMAAFQKAQEVAIEKSMLAAADVMIKHMEMLVADEKLAAEIAARQREQAIMAFDRFFDAYLKPRQLAVERAAIEWKLMNELSGLSNEFFNSLMAEAKLKFEPTVMNVELEKSQRDLLASIARDLSSAFGNSAAAAASSIISVAQSSLTGFASA